MATLGKRKPNTLKPSGHQKTDSEALEDLSSAFHDLDIDGEGLLDQASFITALKMLGVNLPSTELEQIFEVLDVDDIGMIAYDKLKEFMKLGKIPSTILSKVKSSGSTKRTSVIFGGNSVYTPINLNKNTPQIGFKTGGKGKDVNHLPVLIEKNNIPNDNDNSDDSDNSDDDNDDADADDDMDNLDPQRMKMLQRAVIVIKKAAMKNIQRDEVITFLKDKGMSEIDIELAYNKAQEQVMSPDERIKYLKDLSNSRQTKLKEQKQLNQYLTNQMTQNNQECELLRNVLRLSVDTLSKVFVTQSNGVINKNAAQELRAKIKQTDTDAKKAEEMKDNQALLIHKRDLETLHLVSQCVTNQKHFHAFLYFHLLEEVIRNSMPHLKAFLSNYNTPAGRDINDDNDYDADDD